MQQQIMKYETNNSASLETSDTNNILDNGINSTVISNPIIITNDTAVSQSTVTLTAHLTSTSIKSDIDNTTIEFDTNCDRNDNEDSLSNKLESTMQNSFTKMEISNLSENNEVSSSSINQSINDCNFGFTPLSNFNFFSKLNSFNLPSNEFSQFSSFDRDCQSFINPEYGFQDKRLPSTSAALLMNPDISSTSLGIEDDEDQNEKKRLRLEDFMRQIVLQINSTSDKIWPNLLLDFTKNFAEYHVPYNRFVTNDHNLLLDILDIALKAIESDTVERRKFACQLLLNIIDLLSQELLQTKVMPVLQRSLQTETATTVRFNLCFVLAHFAQRFGFCYFVSTIFPYFEQMYNLSVSSSSSVSSSTTIAICFASLDSLIFLLSYLLHFNEVLSTKQSCFRNNSIGPCNGSDFSTKQFKTENLNPSRNDNLSLCSNSEGDNVQAPTDDQHQHNMNEVFCFIRDQFLPLIKQLFQTLIDYITQYRNSSIVLEQESLECFLQWKDQNRANESITQTLFCHYQNLMFFTLLLRDYLNIWNSELCHTIDHDEWYLEFFNHLCTFLYDQPECGNNLFRNSLAASLDLNLSFANQSTNSSINNTQSASNYLLSNIKPVSVSSLSEQSADQTQPIVIDSPESLNSKTKVNIFESSVTVESNQTSNTFDLLSQSKPSSISQQSFIGKYQITETKSSNINNFGTNSFDGNQFGLNVSSINNLDIFGFFKYKTIPCKLSLIDSIPFLFDLYYVTKSSIQKKNSDQSEKETSSKVLSNGEFDRDIPSISSNLIADKLVVLLNTITHDSNHEIAIKMINMFEKLVSRISNPLRFYSFLVNFLHSQNIDVLNHLITNFFTIFSSMVLSSPLGDYENTQITIEIIMKAFLRCEEFLSSKPKWRLYIQYLDVLLRLTRLVSVNITRKLIIPRLLFRFSTIRPIPCRQAVARCLLISYIENFAQKDFDRLLSEKSSNNKNVLDIDKDLQLDFDLFNWFESNLRYSSKYQDRQVYIDIYAILLRLLLQQNSAIQSNFNHYLADILTLGPALNTVHFQNMQHLYRSNNDEQNHDWLCRIECSKMFVALILRKYNVLQSLSRMATEDKVSTIRASACTVLHCFIFYMNHFISTSWKELSKDTSKQLCFISVVHYFDSYLNNDSDGSELLASNIATETDRITIEELKKLLVYIEDVRMELSFISSKLSSENYSDSNSTVDQNIKVSVEDQTIPVNVENDDIVLNDILILMDELLQIVEKEYKLHPLINKTPNKAIQNGPNEHLIVKTNDTEKVQSEANEVVDNEESLSPLIQDFKEEMIVEENVSDTIVSTPELESNNTTSPRRGIIVISSSEISKSEPENKSTVSNSFGCKNSTKKKSKSLKKNSSRSPNSNKNIVENIPIDQRSTSNTATLHCMAKSPANNSISNNNNNNKRIVNSSMIPSISFSTNSAYSMSANQRASNSQHQFSQSNYPQQRNSNTLPKSNSGPLLPNPVVHANQTQWSNSKNGKNQQSNRNHSLIQHPSSVQRANSLLPHSKNLPLSTNLSKLPVIYDKPSQPVFPMPYSSRFAYLQTSNQQVAFSPVAPSPGYQRMRPLLQPPQSLSTNSYPAPHHSHGSHYSKSISSHQHTTMGPMNGSANSKNPAKLHGQHYNYVANHKNSRLTNGTRNNTGSNNNNNNNSTQHKMMTNVNQVHNNSFNANNNNHYSNSNHNRRKSSKSSNPCPISSSTSVTQPGNKSKRSCLPVKVTETAESKVKDSNANCCDIILSSDVNSRLQNGHQNEHQQQPKQNHHHHQAHQEDVLEVDVNDDLDSMAIDPIEN